MSGVVDSNKTSSKVAIRLPVRTGKTVSSTIVPNLMVHEGLRQILERRLSHAHEGPAVLSITDNQGSVLIQKVSKKVLYVRLHFMFLGADPKVLTALVNCIVHSCPESNRIVDEFIEQNFPKYFKKRRHGLTTEGKHHDLRKIFDEINEEYFDGTCTARITWGTKSTCPIKLPRKSLRLGHYTYLEKLVSIHPLLDRPWVPKYFVAAVVYHEMLHHMMPGSRSDSSKSLKAQRVLYHPPEFLEREKLFRHFNKAAAWEQKHVHRLLRAK